MRYIAPFFWTVIVLGLIGLWLLLTGAIFQAMTKHYPESGSLVLVHAAGCFLLGMGVVILVQWFRRAHRHTRLARLEKKYGVS